MKKIFTIAAMASLISLGARAEGETPAFTYDFVPEVQQTIFQDIYDSESGEMTTQVRIDVKFPDEVWWISGVSGYCYLLDSEGNKYEDWKRDFSGPASDYSMFYFGVNGLSKYVDADYTLVIPQGIFGDSTWNSDLDGGKSNPELRYEFNAWKLAGCPREDKTVYDFNPTSSSYTVEEVRISGQRMLELQLALDFSEAVAISDDFQNKWSVYSGDEYLSDAIVRAWVNENDPNQVIVGLRGVDLKTSVDYRLSIWTASFGTLEWASEQYCEGRANSPLEYTVNPKSTGIETVVTDQASDSPVFNMQGIQVNPGSMTKGIYIRDGKKFVVK